eukprot:1340428-Amorphochlora_amoeboformis.AAC.1
MQDNHKAEGSTHDASRYVELWDLRVGLYLQQDGILDLALLAKRVGSGPGKGNPWVRTTTAGNIEKGNQVEFSTKP